MLFNVQYSIWSSITIWNIKIQWKVWMTTCNEINHFKSINLYFHRRHLLIYKYASRQCYRDVKCMHVYNSFKNRNVGPPAFIQAPEWGTWQSKEQHQALSLIFFGITEDLKNKISSFFLWINLHLLTHLWEEEELL